jgi:hypothetical protein
MDLELFFVKSFPWPLDIHGSKLSFYLNIVRKNIVCDVGLGYYVFFVLSKNHLVQSTFTTTTIKTIIMPPTFVNGSLFSTRGPL